MSDVSNFLSQAKRCFSETLTKISAHIITLDLIIGRKTRYTGIWDEYKLTCERLKISLDYIAYIKQFMEYDKAMNETEFDHTETIAISIQIAKYNNNKELELQYEKEYKELVSLFTNCESDATDKSKYKLLPGNLYEAFYGAFRGESREAFNGAFRGESREAFHGENVIKNMDNIFVLEVIQGLHQLLLLFSILDTYWKYNVLINKRDPSVTSSESMHLLLRYVNKFEFLLKHFPNADRDTKVDPMTVFINWKVNLAANIKVSGKTFLDDTKGFFMLRHIRHVALWDRSVVHHKNGKNGIYEDILYQFVHVIYTWCTFLYKKENIQSPLSPKSQKKSIVSRFRAVSQEKTLLIMQQQEGYEVGEWAEQKARKHYQEQFPKT